MALFRSALFLGVTALLATGCSALESSPNSENWKPQEIAVMTMTRCLVTGGHFSRNDATIFIAQINQEQSGQFQRVYDSIATGVSEEVNKTIIAAIDQAGGCRSMLMAFVDSEPETPFKKQIQADWMLTPIEYPDEK